MEFLIVHGEPPVPTTPALLGQFRYRKNRPLRPTRQHRATIQRKQLRLVIVDNQRLAHRSHMQRLTMPRTRRNPHRLTARLVIQQERLVTFQNRQMRRLTRPCRQRQYLFPRYLLRPLESRRKPPNRRAKNILLAAWHLGQKTTQNKRIGQTVSVAPINRQQPCQVRQGSRLLRSSDKLENQQTAIQTLNGRTLSLRAHIIALAYYATVLSLARQA